MKFKKVLKVINWMNHQGYFSEPHKDERIEMAKVFLEHLEEKKAAKAKLKSFDKVDDPKVGDTIKLNASVGKFKDHETQVLEIVTDDEGITNYIVNSPKGNKLPLIRENFFMPDVPKELPKTKTVEDFPIGSQAKIIGNWALIDGEEVEYHGWGIGDTVKIEEIGLSGWLTCSQYGKRAMQDIFPNDLEPIKEEPLKLEVGGYAEVTICPKEGSKFEVGTIVYLSEYYKESASFECNYVNSYWSRAIPEHQLKPIQKPNHA